MKDRVDAYHTSIALYEQSVQRFVFFGFLWQYGCMLRPKVCSYHGGKQDHFPFSRMVALGLWNITRIMASQRIILSANTIGKCLSGVPCSGDPGWPCVARKSCARMWEVLSGTVLRTGIPLATTVFSPLGSSWAHSHISPGLQ